MLWAGLVALWLFVLFPILADRHPRIRRTTDAALATRVLIRGGSKSRRRRGPAAGHNVDPDWCPSPEDYEGSLIGESKEVPMSSEQGPDMIGEVDDAQAHEEDTRSEVTADREHHSHEHGSGRRYRPGRGGFDPEADAMAREAKFAFRQRMILALFVGAIVASGLSLFVNDQFWWVAGGVIGLLAGYLGYLRRQVQIEQEIRRRRSDRFSRGRLDPNDDASEPGRAGVKHRPVVLELDDEDPAFEHLGTVRRAGAVRGDEVPMRRAAGQ